MNKIIKRPESIEIHQLTEKINNLQSKIDIFKNKELVSSVIKKKTY